MTTYLDAAIHETLALDASPSGRVVLIPIARFDRRATAALSHARTVPAADRIAVHVVEDQAAADELEPSWLVSGIDLPPELLHTGRSVAVSVTEAAEELLQGQFDEVVVVVARQVLHSRLRRLLHDESGEALARTLAVMLRVLSVVLPVPVTRSQQRGTARLSSDLSSDPMPLDAHRSPRDGTKPEAMNR